MRPTFAARVRRLRSLLSGLRADAFLTLHPPNVFYLCGFTGSSGALLVDGHSAVFFTDGRYATQAPQEVVGARVKIAGVSLPQAVGAYLKEHGRSVVAVEPARLTLAQERVLSKCAGKHVPLVRAENFVERLRAVKDSGEIFLMQKAAALGSRVFESVLQDVRPGVREYELAAEIDYRMRRAGASGPAFETIVAFGERSALPHAHPTGRKLRKNELVVLDLGAILRHYCCDLTRTVYVGRAPSRVRAWYQAVLEAQAAARDALKPGVSGARVDEAARNTLKAHGLEQYFIHSTGHGLGLEVHEEPRVARGQQQELQAYNVVTLEPGVYVPGVGGIRIEDDAVVTPRGAKILTDANRKFLEL